MKVFTTSDAQLGEGPLWHPQRQSLFWLDILNQKLYEKAFPATTESIDRQWALPEMTSALAVDAMEPGRLWMVTDKSFGVFGLDTCIYDSLVDLNLANGMRANDGAVGPHGDFWFGSMEREPTGLNGAVYSISTEGKLTQHLGQIGIPNTFCWSKTGDRFYLSDSLRQQIFGYQYSGSNLGQETSEQICDLSDGVATPDGGAVDQHSNLWCCLWDGFRVVCYNPEGDVLDYIDLPVPRPTSCCFGGPDNRYLFITSARDGLSPQQLKEHPQSGSVFVVELAIPGLPISKYSMVGH